MKALTDACGYCDLEGGIEPQSNPYQERAWWCCPLCGGDNEIEWQPGLEPDDRRW